MVVAGCQENESCSKVLNFLERLDDRIRCTHEETVAADPSLDFIKGELEDIMRRVSRAVSQKPLLI